MMKFYTGWLIVVCFFATLIGVFVILDKKSSGAPLDVSFATTTSPVVASSTAAKPPQNIPAGYKEYRNKHYGFSVYYPAEIPPQEFPDREDALTVLFQGGAGEPGFQIYVAPIKGTQITPERFNMDEPSGVKQETHDTVIDGVLATTFFGFDARLGKTSEVWFIKDHFLYEISTYKELEPWLNQILVTWRFTK